MGIHQTEWERTDGADKRHHRLVEAGKLRCQPAISAYGGLGIRLLGPAHVVGDTS
jgi:hypothetical protein